MGNYCSIFISYNGFAYFCWPFNRGLGNSPHHWVLKPQFWLGRMNKELCHFSQHLRFHPSIALWIYYPLCSGYLYSGHLEPWEPGKVVLRACERLHLLKCYTASQTNSVITFLCLGNTGLLLPGCGYHRNFWGIRTIILVIHARHCSVI